MVQTSHLSSFQHIRIFQLFEVRLESCVFWLADSFQTKVEGHHQQVVVTSSVCFWKRLVLAMSTPDRRRFRTRLISLVVVLSIWAMPGPFSGCYLMTKGVRKHKVVKGDKPQSLSPPHLCHHCRRVHKCRASFHKHPCPLLHSSPRTTRMSFFDV